MKSIIDDTIETVESLYESLTGCEAPPPNGEYARVPPEADPLAHIEAQLARLANLVEHPEPIATPMWNPPTALWEDDNDLVVEMELAGLGRSDIEVSVIRQLVTVTGTRRASSSARVTWVNERCSGPFLRTIHLPDYIDPRSVRTNFQQGLLLLRFSYRVKPTGDQKSSDQN